MKRLLLIALLLIVGCSQKSVDKTTGAGQEPALTIDRIVSQPSITGTAPSSPSWSADSRQLAFLWNDSGLPRREIWIVKGDGSGLRRLTSEIEGTRGVDLFVWTPDAEDLIYLRSGDVWRVSFANGDGKRLTETGGNKSNLTVSGSSIWGQTR